MVSFGGADTPARIARAICREIEDRNGDPTDRPSILAAANKRVFGDRYPPRPWTKARRDIIERGWVLAESKEFSVDRL